MFFLFLCWSFFLRSFFVVFVTFSCFNDVISDTNRNLITYINLSTNKLSMYLYLYVFEEFPAESNLFDSTLKQPYA